MANGILVSPLDAMTPVAGPIRDPDTRVFTIKYRIETEKLLPSKQVQTCGRLVHNAVSNVNSIRQHYGFLRVSSCTQSIRVYS